MLDGFQPNEAATFFERRRAYSLLMAIVMIGGPMAYVIDSAGEHEKTIEVKLEPEIEDFAVQEEEPEPEVEPEEPPPPPPPNAKIKVVDNPVPRPKVETPDKKVTDAAEESDREKVVEVAAQRGDPSHIASSGREPPAGPKPAPPRPEAPKAPPKPKAAPKKTQSIDPTKPVDRPVNATAPQPLASNTVPQYPQHLRDEGITGRYVVKLLVYRDGTVRGMKVLRKNNTATGSGAQEEANKAFLAAIVKVVKAWKYQPSTLEGTPITVWHTVTIPFTLTQ